MKLVSTPRIEFLRTLAAEILHNYGRGRTIIAVDGSEIDGSEKAGRVGFADDLAAVFRESEHPTFRASLRNFQHSRAEQQRLGGDGLDVSERLYRVGYDYSALRRVLVEPFRLGGSTGFVTEEFDPDRDAWIQPTWQTAPADAILIVDGAYSNRPELHGLWLFSVLLESEPGSDSDRQYLADVRPRDLVSAVVDNTDATLPRRVLTDRC
ncbi:hypothetical protein E3T46_09820 [Cryobacterium sp. Hh11]|uniref:hypothetical protein n=1 Tax=Cryobacterium sp. Hh11 TaxID=2555868 RepID=UPI00106D53A0|nr:hypothetical protein [Cryobacterium sp. Hh11]TFD50862.1 hypothetical protein E3T46_09820 [Cryobacterium sp. Hh11]